MNGNIFISKHIHNPLRDITIAIPQQRKPRLNLQDNCGMYIPLSDDKHQMVRNSSKICTGQRGCNSNPVAMLPHAAVVFRMQPFNYYQ